MEEIEKKSEQSAMTVQEESKSRINAKKVFFDIANSVKGGSGKSTFSLLLAAYYNSEDYNRSNSRKAVAYIIDLDLRGTSWEKNYGRYISTDYFTPNDNDSLLTYSSSRDSLKPNEETTMRIKRYHDFPFINSLMQDFKTFCTKPFLSIIRFATMALTPEQGNSENTCKIYLCPAKTENGTEVDQIEVDIFEHTIYQVIEKILNDHISDDIDDVHIIFDMPPSYEKHAEAIIKHLLTSQSSELFQKAVNKKGVYEYNQTNQYYEPYVINLFMLAAVSASHIEQNGVYLFHWLQNLGYSDRVYNLLEDNRLRIRYILNDIANYAERILGISDPKGLEEWRNSIIDRMKNDRSSFYKKIENEVNSIEKEMDITLLSLRVLPCLHFKAAAEYFDTSTNDAPSPPLIITEAMLEAIKPLVDI